MTFVFLNQVLNAAPSVERYKNRTETSAIKLHKKLPAIKVLRAVFTYSPALSILINHHLSSKLVGKHLLFLLPA